MTYITIVYFSALARLREPEGVATALAGTDSKKNRDRLDAVHSGSLYCRSQPQHMNKPSGELNGLNGLYFHEEYIDRRELQITLRIGRRSTSLESSFSPSVQHSRLQLRAFSTSPIPPTWTLNTRNQTHHVLELTAQRFQILGFKA